MAAGNGNRPRRNGKRHGNSRLTAKIRDQICELLRKGHYVRSACAKAGIHHSTLYDWEERGRAARALRETGQTVPRVEQPYLDFLEQVELARDAGEAWLVEQILETAAEARDGTAKGAKAGVWTAYMTILERTRRERWGRRDRVDHSTPDGKPFAMRLDLAKLTAEQLESLKALLETAAPE